MKLFIIVIAFILIAVIVIFGVDLYFWMNSLYSRYHIGRLEWDAWRKALEDRTVCWLEHTPVVKITDNSRYILFDMLKGRYRSKTIQSWQKAALILGLLADKKKYAVNVTDAASEMLNADGNWKSLPNHVDCGMLSFAVMKALGSQMTKNAMNETVHLIMSHLNSEGMIRYTNLVDDFDMYVDTIGLCCPFLVYYAREYSMPQYEKLAFEQIKQFHQFGLLYKTNLPNHAYNTKNNLPLGVYGWGRGSGWYVIGLMDSYDNFVNKEIRDIVFEWIREAAEEYRLYQRDDGGFGSILQSPKTYDSSATAIMAWFFARCSKLFANDEYYKVALKCLNKLRMCTRINGAIDWCQGDTKGIGIFSQTYDIMPFAQGMTLRALGELDQQL